MEKIVYTKNGTGGPLSYKRLREPAKGQAGLQGKMGVAPWPLLEAQV